MLFNKNKQCGIYNSMPVNDVYSNMDMSQNYMKHDMSMKGESCGCGCKKDMNYMTNMGGCKMQPVYEQPIEKCIHRTICHEVPHVCPINTKIINHHIYRHTYSPCYSCCEENQVSQVNEGSCCCFK